MENIGEHLSPPYPMECLWFCWLVISLLQDKVLMETFLYSFVIYGKKLFQFGGDWIEVVCFYQDN